MFQRSEHLPERRRSLFTKINNRLVYLPGQIDCGNMSPEYGRLRIDRGTHSIEYVR